MAAACRPENVATVQELIEEVGADIQIVTDPEATGLFMHLTQDRLESDYADAPRIQSGLADKESSEAIREVRVVIHRPEQPHRIRIETGPERTSVHLD